MEEMPSEILYMIFQILPERSGLLACVCRFWRDLVVSMSFPKRKRPGEKRKPAQYTCIQVIVETVPLVAWAIGMGLEMDEEVFVEAVGKGDLEVVKFLEERDCEWGPEVCAKAAKKGHAEILRWLHKKGCEWDSQTCAYAALFGDLKTLEWLRRKDCPWDSETCSNAALNDHLELLRWAHEHGCPWDGDTCAHLARNGRLAELQWALAKGCEWDWRTFARANDYGHLAVAEWALCQNCPWLFLDSMSFVIKARHWSIFRLAIQKGYRWHSAENQRNLPWETLTDSELESVFFPRNK